ncbi:MAG: efflux RND transporter periplasmic adaptor subunit, partial [Planctomycetota bacterium]
MSTHDEAQDLELSTVRRPTAASVLGALAMGAAILAALFLLGFIPLRRRHAELLAEVERTKASLPIVNVALPGSTTRTTDLTLPGTVRAFQQTDVCARTNGYLKRWLVDIGDEVNAGQRLAEIEVPELDQELGQARASLQQLQARVAVARANVDLADSTLKRYEVVAPVGAITQQELAERRAATAVARANVDAALADQAVGE